MWSTYKLCYVLLNTCFSTEHTFKEGPGWPCAWCLSHNRSSVNVCGTKEQPDDSCWSRKGHTGAPWQGARILPLGSNLEGDQVSLFSSTSHRNWANPLLTNVEDKAQEFGVLFVWAVPTTEITDVLSCCRFLKIPLMLITTFKLWSLLGQLLLDHI